MKRNNLSIGSEQQHLSLAVLRRYQEGALPAAEEHRVEKHVLACELCADILAGMEAQSGRQTAAAVGEIHRRIAAARERRPAQVIPLFSRRNLAVAATILLLLCSAGVVFFYNLEQVNQKRQPTVATTPSKPVDPEVPELRPAPAPPPVAQARPPAPLASTPPAAAKREASVGAVAQQNKLPGQEAGGVAAVAAEDIVVEVLPPRPQGPGIKPDSGDARIGAVAAAPATAAPGEVLRDRAAGVSMEKEARSRVMARARTADASAGKTISGQVSGAAGQPLSGVTVLLKGTTRGTVTDQQGRYSLPLPQSAEEVTLAYNFIGYTPLEKKIKAGAPAAGDVTLEADNKALSEVVVVGYGQQNSAAADVTAPATPVGGWSNYKKYLQANVKHPGQATGRKVSGRVVVGFTVNPDGSLTDVRVLKSLSAATDAEALRLVQQGPGWQPAKAGDKAAPQPVRVTIRFRANE